MIPFTSITGVAAPIPISNVNTDIIAPKVLMRAVSREGLGWGLFGPYRYRDDGAERPEFILNRAPFREAKLIVARENFGCGSSREHAAWALLDFGIRVVIAESFAEIFFNNCSRNGILLITLHNPELEKVSELAITGQPLTVDLETQTVSTATVILTKFDIAPGLKARLLAGQDEVAATLLHVAAIEAYECASVQETPWRQQDLTR